MNSVLSFLKKSTNLYFLIIILFTLVVCLTGISFSYYIPNSSNEAEIQLTSLSSTLSSPLLKDGYINLRSQEMISIPITIKNNNSFDVKYMLYYIENDNMEITIDKKSDNNLKANEEIELTLNIYNYDAIEKDVYIGLKTNYENKDVYLNENEMEIK